MERSDGTCPPPGYRSAGWALDTLTFPNNSVVGSVADNVGCSLAVLAG